MSRAAKIRFTLKPFASCRIPPFSRKNSLFSVGGATTRCLLSDEEIAATRVRYVPSNEEIAAAQLGCLLSDEEIAAARLTKEESAKARFGCLLSDEEIAAARLTKEGSGAITRLGCLLSDEEIAAARPTKEESATTRFGCLLSDEEIAAARTVGLKKTTNLHRKNVEDSIGKSVTSVRCHQCTNCRLHRGRATPCLSPLPRASRKTPRDDASKLSQRKRIRLFESSSEESDEDTDTGAPRRMSRYVRLPVRETTEITVTHTVTRTVTHTVVPTTTATPAVIPTTIANTVTLTATPAATPAATIVDLTSDEEFARTWVDNNLSSRRRAAIDAIERIHSIFQASDSDESDDEDETQQNTATVPKLRVHVPDTISRAGLRVLSTTASDPLECPVCMDETFEASGDDMLCYLTCSHAMHKKCILEWAKHSSACPTCKSTMRVI